MIKLTTKFTKRIAKST